MKMLLKGAPNAWAGSAPIHGGKGVVGAPRAAAAVVPLGGNAHLHGHSQRRVHRVNPPHVLTVVSGRHRRRASPNSDAKPSEAH